MYKYIYIYISLNYKYINIYFFNFYILHNVTKQSCCSCAFKVKNIDKKKNKLQINEKYLGERKASTLLSVRDLCPLRV